MTTTFHDLDLTVFSTSPPWQGASRSDYLRRLADTARWSEAAGCTGSLIYTDNAQLDPWLVAGLLLAQTSSLTPLVAVQPIYMHPYTVAKLVASFARIHGRRSYLNFVAGGFTNDLKALNDTTPHDRRYDRLTEYAEIIRSLTDGGPPTSRTGEFYATDGLSLKPAVPPSLRPGFLLSGSSPAGRAAARRLGATAVSYPRSAGETPPVSADDAAGGIRLGIIAREVETDAWEIAASRFPVDRCGQLAHQLARRVSDSHWHRTLSASTEEEDQDSPYWLEPFRQNQTMCPYLVGSHERVAAELGRFLALGYRTFILDVPASPDDLAHTTAVFAAARNACERSFTS